MWTSIFISYASEDKALFNKLEKHLGYLKHQNLIKLWHEQMIEVGSERESTLRRYQRTAKIILLLISSDFMHSPSCYNIMKQAMERHEQEKARVIPVYLRDVYCQGAFSIKFEVLPPNKKPITSWANRDEAFRAVVEGVRLTIGTRHNLPPLHKFLGRKRDVERVREGLTSSEQIISLEGMAGIGKSTLALHIAHSCLLGSKAHFEPSFDYVVWTSTEDRPKQSVWFSEILDTIADILGYPLITELPIEQKREKIDKLLCRYRTLVIVDNFETMIDGTDLNEWIESIPKPSKILITSPSNQLRNKRIIDLERLDKTSALQLIHEYLEIQPNDHDKDLHLLIDFTKGNPLAIKLALGRIQNLGLDHVIKYLETHSQGKQEDVCNQLLSWAWEVMSQEAKNLLKVTSFFADSMGREALIAASGLTSGSQDAAIIELVGLMLLDNRGPVAKKTPRYSIHPLTRAFASVQLREIREFEKRARIRWSEYYIGYVRGELKEVRETFKQSYWNAIAPYKNYENIDIEWPNLQEVLEWADGPKHEAVLVPEELRERYSILVDLTLLLAHHMSRRMQFPMRLYYAEKAANVASELGRKEDAALLHIDAHGWVLLEVGNLEKGAEEITKGLRIAETLEPSSTDRTDLIALAKTWLAKASLNQGDLTKAQRLIDEARDLGCNLAVQRRVYTTAGDIEYKMGHYGKAKEHCEHARDISKKYNGEGEGTYARLGNVYLALNNLDKAEECFTELLDMEQRFGGEEIPYAKFGLACVAQRHKEKEEARRRAKEVLSYLSGTSHTLRDEILEFLQDLGDPPSV